MVCDAVSRESEAANTYWRMLYFTFIHAAYATITTSEPVELKWKSTDNPPTGADVLACYVITLSYKDTASAPWLLPLAQSPFHPLYQ